MPSLDEIFKPRSIALVGVSPNKRNFIQIVLQSLIDADFPAIYPVNPNYPTIMGLPCYPNIRSIKDSVDHVIVSIPANQSLAILDDCAVKNVNSVHFFTAGFTETGIDARIDLENRLLKKARSSNFRIIGPNSTGLHIPGCKAVNVPNIPVEAGKVGFISQSGGHAHNLPLYSSPRGVRFSKVVSYGNGLDINECELLEYMTKDKDTEINRYLYRRGT